MSQILPHRFGWIALGIATGLAGLLPMRTVFYLGTGITTEMAPQMAYIFSPLIFLFVVLFAFVAELLLQLRFSRPSSRAHGFLIGVAYVSLLLVWAFPGYGWIMVLLNPFILRWLVNRAQNGGPSAA